MEAQEGAAGIFVFGSSLLGVFKVLCSCSRLATLLSLDSFDSQWAAEVRRSFPKGMPIGRTLNN